MSRSARWIPLGALAVTVVYRIVYFTQIRQNPYFDAPFMDEAYHDLWAREIAAGDWTSRIPFYRAPFYPVLLGLAYRVFGADPPSYGLIRALQLGLGAMTPLLVIPVARRLVPDRPAVAWIAALVTALDGMLAYFEADLLLESLLAPIGVASVWLLLRAGETGGARRWLAAGLLLGVFAVTRPNVLAFTPFVFVAALGWSGEGFSLRRPRWSAALAVTAGVSLWVLPVAAINRFVGHDRTFIAWQGGLNFFLGNNPESNGWSATAPSLLRIDWWDGYDDAIRIAEEAAGHELRPAEISDYWFRRGLDWWRANPLAALALLGKKTVYFISGVEFSNNREIRLFLEEFAPIGRPALLLSYVTIPFALAGAVMLWRRRSPGGRLVVLWVVVYAVTVVAFFVTARYRVPLRPIFTILAALGFLTVLEGLRRGRGRAWAAALGVILFGVAVNANPWIREYAPSRAQFYQSVAVVHEGRGRIPEALAWQRRAVEADSTYPDGNLNLGTLYMRVDRPAEAVAAFERGRSVDPRDGRNLASLAHALQKLGRWSESEARYREAEAAGHLDPGALYNHGVCLEKLDRPEEAASLYRRAVGIDSTFADAWNNLGVLAARAGRLDEAITLWETALARAPGHERALQNLERAKRLEEDRKP